MAPPPTTSSTTTTTEPEPVSFCDTSAWPADGLPSPERLTVVETDLVLDCDMTVGALLISPTGSLTFEGTPEHAAMAFFAMLQGLQTLCRAKSDVRAFKKAAATYIDSMALEQ